jgi:hypothetical protein
MAEKKEEMDKIYNKAMADVKKASEVTIPTGEFAYQTFHESNLNEAKQKIIKDKGMEGAVKYLKSKDGQKHLMDQVMELSYTKSREGLKDLPEWRINSLTANYLPNQQRLAQGLNEAGAKFHYGHMEEVLAPNIALDKQMQFMSLTNYDERAKSALVKATGADKYLKNLDDISKTQAAQIYTINNDGGTPIGPDMLRNLGLEDLIKDTYKNKK